MEFKSLKYYNRLLENINDIDIVNTSMGKKLCYMSDFVYNRKDLGFALLYDYIKANYDINEVFKDEEAGTIYTETDIYNNLCQFFNQTDKNKINLDGLLTYFNIENDFDEKTYTSYSIAFDCVLNTKNVNKEIEK